MAFKYIAVFALVAVATAIELDHHYNHHHQHQPLLVKKLVEVEHEAPAHYDFEYSGTNTFYKITFLLIRSGSGLVFNQKS